jgi:exopolysaccharide biosynthesis polyprenyl glycosylphosphotransferase
MLKQQARFVARVVYLLDLGLTAAAFFGAFLVRDWLFPILLPKHFPTGLLPIGEYLKFFPVVLIVWSFLLLRSDTYHSHRTVPLGRETFATLRLVALGIVLLGTVAWFGQFAQLSRMWFLLFGVLTASFFVGLRIVIRAVARYVRARGMNYRTILIVGTGRKAREIVRVIEGHKYWGYKIVGFVSDGHRLPQGWGRYRVLGKLSDLRKIIEETITGKREAIDEIIFAVDRRKLEASKPIFLIAEEVGIRTRAAMNFFPNRFARVEVEDLEGVPLLTFSTTSSNAAQLAMKRMLDVSLAAVLLVLSMPVLLLTALAIKLTSPGSVLYKQERLGLNGRIFTLYKFRTMVEDAHRLRAELAHLNEMSGPVFKATNDPRVTPVGRVLRRFSFDEIPQLWNVIRGDMSLVGPRPPIPEEVWRYERWQRRRLSMKPGLTCLWQVSGRNEVDFDRWMELDLQYIDNWSPSLDFKIMLRTIPVVLSGRGAS